MLNRKGEISTIVILGTLVVIGVAALMSSTLNNNQRTLDTRADFDGTSCNDDIGDTLNSSGSTSFNVTCSGNLDKPSTYVFFWCPELSKGASYCGDVRDIKGSKSQVLAEKQGATVPNTYQSTDKTCGCVSWQVGVQNAAGEMGFAGAGLICSENACTEKVTVQPTNSQNNSNSSGSSVVSTPTPLLGAVARMATSAPTPTQTQGFLKQSGSQVINTPTPRLGAVARIASVIPTPTTSSISDLTRGNVIPTTAQTQTFIPTFGDNNQTTIDTKLLKIEKIKTQAEIIISSCKQGNIYVWDNDCAVVTSDAIDELDLLLNKK